MTEQPASDILEDDNHPQQQLYKVGWLNVTRQVDIMHKSTIGGIVKSYLSPNTQSHSYFAVLKQNTLYLYDSELQLDCKSILNLSFYTIHLYPTGLKDYEAFSKRNRILIKNHQQHYYINCSRCVDKEDWYFCFLKATKLSNMDHTRFDQVAMNHLISTLHSNPSHFEMQWFNALLGRIFLGIYKTQKSKSFFYNKILSKVDKLNARRPHFLEHISIRSVDGGRGSPQITQPRFIHLSPQGEYTGDFHFFYDGHFRVELETVLKWKYSDRLPPICIDLVLAITLKSIQGKMMLKVKEPPTNRVWIGFYKKPNMEWIVDPVVWEKRIGYSVVSKAIQTKIEEILIETLVLPNMDDIVFFQNDGMGGIFEKPQERYQSMPELYSTPSQLIVTADSFPLLTTQNQHQQKKKRWFKKTDSLSNATTINEQFSTSPESDTPSQQSLKSFISNKSKKRTHKKASKQIVLSAKVDHSVNSIQKSPTMIPEDINDPLHSVRLSQKMLDVCPSRLRSKSLPSTSLSEISVINNQ